VFALHGQLFCQQCEPFASGTQMGYDRAAMFIGSRSGTVFRERTGTATITPDLARRGSVGRWCK